MYKMRKAKKNMCITVIDMLNPGMNMVFKDHDLDGKTETCKKCGIVLKNFKQYLSQNLLVPYNTKTDSIQYGVLGDTTPIDRLMDEHNRKGGC